MWLGDFQLGDFLPLRLVTQTSAGVPTAPDDTPTALIYDAANTLIETISLPVLLPNRFTGLFAKEHRLSSSYAAGQHHVLYQFAISSTTYYKTENFTIVGGGSATGAVIGMQYYERPQANFVVYATDDGSITAGKNPK